MIIIIMKYFVNQNLINRHFLFNFYSQFQPISNPLNILDLFTNNFFTIVGILFKEVYNFKEFYVEYLVELVFYNRLKLC